MRIVGLFKRPGKTSKKAVSKYDFWREKNSPSVILMHIIYALVVCAEISAIFGAFDLQHAVKTKLDVCMKLETERAINHIPPISVANRHDTIRNTWLTPDEGLSLFISNHFRFHLKWQVIQHFNCYSASCRRKIVIFAIPTIIFVHEFCHISLKYSVETTAKCI